MWVLGMEPWSSDLVASDLSVEPSGQVERESSWVLDMEGLLHAR